MFIETSYFVYLAISIGVTIWVARTLHHRGHLFLVDAFQGNQQLAESVNHLLVVGFYLINLGYVAFTMKTSSQVSDLRASIELLADKLGLVLVVLGIMHLFNVFVFSRFRRRALDRLEFPVMPDQTIPPPQRG